MQVKGSAISTIVPFVKAKFGTGSVGKFLAALPRESRKILESPILATEWYPLSTALTDPLAKLCELFYKGDNAGAWDSGRFSADQGLKGMYRIFVMLGSPTYTAKKAASILPQYYAPSDLEVGEVTRGKAVLRIKQFPEISAVIEARIGGWMERAIEIAGGKNAKIAIAKSLANGHACTEYLCTWA